ncbi:MAG TPA: WYL domain-containing protein [Atribacteraceae bacterium]|nr:WYL domain-containing protein [Atribacteraceae bacterium]
MLTGFISRTLPLIISFGMMAPREAVMNKANKSRRLTGVMSILNQGKAASAKEIAASQPLLNQEGIAICRQLQSALVKVESVIRSGADTHAYKRLKRHFTYLSSQQRDYSPWQGMIATLTDCICRSRSVTAVYDSYSGGKVTERILDPYHLFWGGEGNLYLAAHCHLHHEVRNFRIDRFKSVKAQNNLFARDPSFNLADYLKPSFRVWSGTEEVSVRFLVYPPASRFFRESSYHHSQQLEELPKAKLFAP